MNDIEFGIYRNARKVKSTGNPAYPMLLWFWLWETFIVLSWGQKDTIKNKDTNKKQLQLK